MLPTHPDPFIFLLPTAFLKPHQHTHTRCLLTCNIRKPAMLLPASLVLTQGAGGRDDSFLLTTHGYPGTAHALCARWASTGGYGKWVQTLWSLKRTGSTRKVSTPHASIADPLTHPLPSNIHWRMIFEHKTILTCSTTSRQQYEGPLPACPLLPSPHLSPAARAEQRGCVRVCTLSVKSINLSAGWKKTCGCVSQVVSQTMIGCQIALNKQPEQHCLLNYKRFLSAYLNGFGLPPCALI